MNWFQENRWLGTFLIGSGVAALAALFFVWMEKGAADDAAAQFATAAAEQNRLQQLDPFPSEPNYRKLKGHIENYAASLEKLKEQLKSHALPPTPLAPNEFQSRLRQAMVSLGEKARANRVKLPDNFALGFEEFTTALPNTDAAPVLGQELAQAEMLALILIDARVDGISAFRRASAPPVGLAPATAAAAPARKPPGPNLTPGAPAAKLVEQQSIDVTFAASPSVTRRALNQIASAPQQFYIARVLRVRNEKDKGPSREQANAGGAAPAQPASAAPAAPGAAKPAGNTALNFIVGNEHLETSARIEMVRFNFPP
jgi:hypothetical protein